MLIETNGYPNCFAPSGCSFTWRLTLLEFLYRKVTDESSSCAGKLSRNRIFYIRRMKWIITRQPNLAVNWAKFRKRFISISFMCEQMWKFPALARECIKLVCHQSEEQNWTKVDLLPLAFYLGLWKRALWPT